MSRLHGRLTALTVKHAVACGRYADGLGLYLQVSPNGSRSWILRYRLGGRRRHLGLGPLPRVSLAEARDLASIARQTLRDGRDPIEVKGSRRAAITLSAARAMSFTACAKAYIEAHRAGWSLKSTDQWTTSLNTYAHPIFGVLPVQEIDTSLVLKVIEPLWATKTETASRVRGRVETVLDWAKTRGYRDGENPARWDGHLEQLLPAKAKVAKVVHHEAMPYADVPAFMAELRARPDIAARALEFTVLLAARSGEVLDARWEEIDARVWVIPGPRMKAGKEHRVPLADASAALLRALPGPHTGLVFPGFKAGRPLAKMALLRVLHAAGHDDITVHGFRSAFRDWAAERTNFPDQVVEQALAHTVGTAVERAYRRGDLFDRRVRLMSEWASFCAGKAEPAAEVIELRRT
jgi:integrase